MIEVQQLTKRFGELTAVDDVSFKVDSGKTLALIGSSGSGKTTILRMVNRLIEPDEGKILVDGEDLTRQPLVQVRRRMGYVIQSMGLFPHYTVAGNIAIVPQLLKWDKERIRERIHTLLEHMGLPPAEYAQKYPDQLSGGQQQRVGLARALAANPPIILMDEPFGALDPITRFHIRREVLQLEEFQDKTIIIVTHDVEEAFEMGDVVCLLDKGRVQQSGTPRTLLEKPANEFVSGFFASQKLHLELIVYTLADVFDHLKPDQPNENAMPFSLHTSLRDVLDQLNSSGKKNGTVKRNDQQRFFDIPTLMRVQHELANS